MIDKKFVKRILHDALVRNRSLEDHNLMHPEREWFIGLSIASLVLCAGAYWCLYIYNTYSEVEVNSDIEQISSQTIYRSQEVNESLQEFAERRTAYNEIRRGLEANRPSTPFIVPTTEPVLDETGATSSKSTGLDVTDTVNPDLEIDTLSNDQAPLQN